MTEGMTQRRGCRPGAAAFVLLAGGSGTRVGGEVNKVYLLLAGRPVIAWSLEWAATVPEVGRIVLVTRPGDETLADHAIVAAGLVSGSGLLSSGRIGVEVIPGGSTRHRSEQAALDHLRRSIAAGSLDVVVIHDGARPLAGAALLRQVIVAAAQHGGAVPTVPERHAWPVDADGTLLPRASATTLHRVQTPQAFRALPLLDAYASAFATGAEGTDTSAAMEARDDVQVVAVPGTTDNLKVTFPADLARAQDVIRLGRLGPADPPRSAP